MMTLQIGLKKTLKAKASRLKYDIGRFNYLKVHESFSIQIGGTFVPFLELNNTQDLDDSIFKRCECDSCVIFGKAKKLKQA